MRWLAALAVSGCIGSNSVICADGQVCPNGTTCIALTAPEDVCATPDQLAACVGKQQAEPCTSTGFCDDGVCITAACGNRHVDPGEQCDDGNATSGDGCSADCRSTESCGNGVVDLIRGETCDDGNFLDHDGCSSACRLESLHWIEHTLTPPARSSGAAAYDPRRDRLVVFGGIGPSNRALDDTWEWTGGDWVKYHGIAPTTRTGAVMAFDGARVILYGGAGLSDTWTYDGLTWIPLQLGMNPGVRYNATMAYDARRHRVVLFGGAMTTDTWEWDGSAWTPVVTPHAPPARSGAMMAYDPVRGVVVLAGGASGLVDTWVYDGVDWRDATPASGPVPPVFGAMAFDTASARMIAFGGGGAAATLAWNGASWTDLGLTSQPPHRYLQQLASTGSRIVLFGGFDISVRGDTWIFETGAWIQPVTPGRFGGVTFDPMVGRIMMFGGQDATGASPTDTWELTSRGWVEHDVPPPVSAGVVTYDPASRDIVNLCANPSANYVFETWEWDGASWSQRHPAHVPDRANRLAFDGHQVTTFGGFSSAAGFSDETWSWDGNDWSLATPADSPPASFLSGEGYDPIRGDLVLLGLINPSTGLNNDDTWTYDGTNWTRHDIVVTPPRGAALIWNPARQRLVLVSSLDTWEWDGSAWSEHGATDLPDSLIFYSATVALDGAGVMIHGGLIDPASNYPATDEWWEERWDGPGYDERCDGSDLDGDHLDRCADPDCWTICTPLCSPGTTCEPGAPSCGDGTCDPDHESCRTCPVDCMCAPVCGDFICDPGETGCPGDCP